MCTMIPSWLSELHYPGRENWRSGGTRPVLDRVVQASIRTVLPVLMLLVSLPANAQAPLPDSETERLRSLVHAVPHPPRLSGMQAGWSGQATVRKLQDRFDVNWYGLDLDIDLDRAPELMGRVRVEGLALTQLDTVALELDPSLVVTAVTAVSGGSVRVARDGRGLFLIPDAPLVTGSHYRFEVAYEGTPSTWSFADGGYSSGRRSGGDPFMWTLSEPYGSAYWWPTEDHPADKADSVRISLTVPAGITAVSQGLLEAETNNGDGTVTWDWVHRYPIATYLVSIAAGEYDRDEQTYVRPADLEDRYGPASFPIEHYAYRDIPAFEGIGATSGWRLTPEVMATFERWFGPYPFAEEKYGNAHFSIRGGMEHQTISSMGNIGIELIAHELAHQWMGDSVTPWTWRDLWLNEGFATLGEMLAFEADPAYAPVQNVLFDLYYDRARNAVGTLVLSDTTDASDMFTHARVYAKGWMVLRMMRHRMGNTDFQHVLETWATRHRYGSATTEDFQQVVEDITGQDWSQFFEQWILAGRGEPTWAMGWSDVSSDTEYRIRVDLHQIQTLLESNVEAFEVPLPLVIQHEQGSTVFVALVNEQEESFEFDLPARPLGVQVDPDRWILRGDTVPMTGTATEQLVEHPIQVHIAPHPAHGPLQVRIEQTGPWPHPVRAEVYDLIGRRVALQHWDALPGAGVLSVPDLPSGRYLLRVHSGPVLDERLVVIQR